MKNRDLLINAMINSFEKRLSKIFGEDEIKKLEIFNISEEGDYVYIFNPLQNIIYEISLCETDETDMIVDLENIHNMKFDKCSSRSFSIESSDLYEYYIKHRLNEIGIKNYSIKLSRNDKGLWHNKLSVRSNTDAAQVLVYFSSIKNG